MNESAKTLVVGAAGFVGQALVRGLKARQLPLLAVSRADGDLNDQQFDRKILTDVKTVYYLAGFRKNIAVHTREPFRALAGNVLPLLNFLEAAKSSDFETLVYVSSTIVEYAKVEDQTLDGYVIGKYLNEVILKAFIAETNKRVVIIRSAAVYGPGNSFDPAEANFIPALIRRVAETESELIVWGNGQRQLQFIYIDDLINNLIAAADCPAGIYSVGHPVPISVNEVVAKIMALMDKKLEIRHDESKPDKPTQLSNFNNLVEPKVDLGTGLAETMVAYQNQ